MEKLNASIFEKEIMGLLKQPTTIGIVADLIKHTKTLELYIQENPSSMEPAPPPKPKPKPEGGKCLQIKEKIKQISAKDKNCEFNIPLIMKKINDFLDYSEGLEKRQKT